MAINHDVECGELDKGVSIYIYQSLITLIMAVLWMIGGSKPPALCSISPIISNQQLP